MIIEHEAHSGSQQAVYMYVWHTDTVSCLPGGPDLLQVHLRALPPGTLYCPAYQQP